MNIYQSASQCCVGRMPSSSQRDACPTARRGSVDVMCDRDVIVDISCHMLIDKIIYLSDGWIKWMDGWMDG